MSEYYHPDPDRMRRNTERAAAGYALQRADLGPQPQPNPLVVILSGAAKERQRTIAVILKVSEKVAAAASELLSELRSMKDAMASHVAEHEWEKTVGNTLIKLLQEGDEMSRLRQLIKIVSRESGDKGGGITGFNIVDLTRQVGSKSKPNCSDTAKKISDLVTKLRGYSGK